MEKDTTENKYPSCTTIISKNWLPHILTIVGIIITYIIAVNSHKYLEQQNEIAKQNNYFTTINNLENSASSLELIIFAYLDEPSKYEELLKYHIMKNKDLVDGNILSMLPMSSRIKILKILLNIIEERVILLEKYNSKKFIKSFELHNPNNIVISNIFSFIKQNILSLVIFTDEDVKEQIKRLRNFSYRYFTLNSLQNINNRPNKIFGEYIPFIGIMDKNLPLIDDNSEMLIHILDILRTINIDNYTKNDFKNISEKVLYNLSLSYYFIMIEYKNTQQIFNLIKNKFIYLNNSDFEDNQKLKLYYLLSLSYIKHSFNYERTSTDIKVLFAKKINLITTKYENKT
ncbi:MAG: hypothetical protein KAQ94_09175 [Arcobacteraceae bacterium]|nr:hypothetical protein [Arcobacteraceae bacterium]